MDDEPEVRENLAEHRFEIWSGGELAGFSVYEDIGGVRAFLHTEIDDGFAGLGLGSVLVRAALTTMRDANIAVLPFCPFIRRYIDRHREFVELVPAEDRAQFKLPVDGGAAAS